MTPERPEGDIVRIPPELESALCARDDGPALRAVYEAVGRETTDPEFGMVDHTTPGMREAAWARLSQRLTDPDRMPYADEVPPFLELVTDEETVRGRPLRAELVAGASPPRAPRRHLRSWAAAAALLIGGGIVWGSGEHRYDSAPGARTVAVSLSDGSRVWLAPGSSLSHPRRWALFGRSGLGWLSPDAREVTLEGEAFFAVARDGRPFLVQTGDAEVRVLGTRFAVRVSHVTHGTRVQVEEGRVAVSHAAQRAELGPGDVAQVVRGALVRGRVPVSRVGVAAQGGMTALDEPLGEVFDDLARRYGVLIERSARVNLASTVSFYFPDEPDVNTVLADLCAAHGLTYTRTSRGYRIDAP